MEVTTNNTVRSYMEVMANNKARRQGLFAASGMPEHAKCTRGEHLVLLHCERIASITNIPHLCKLSSISLAKTWEVCVSTIKFGDEALKVKSQLQLGPCLAGARIENELNELLLRYWHISSMKANNIGKTDIIQHRIHTIAEHPIKQHPYRESPKQRRVL
ncbi:hypothetical protein SELMODRAFT_412965 [Selaginella moellendorffii]|uniref:Uncharacterized protein n=1 Tax=Selaginella moellendorffii TaxID=88036 RepID=D8RMX4_SELML|nr:hypothetical protein SELMODRAFT_412965 [Selaginella moellendorffii]